MNSNNNNRLDFEAIKKAATGRWLEIIPAIAPAFSQAALKPRQHVPCPLYGGKDGFRFDKRGKASEKGSAYSNKDGSLGNGFKVLMWYFNCDIREAMSMVNDFFGGTVSTVTPIIAVATTSLSVYDEMSIDEKEKRRATLNNLWKGGVSLSSPLAHRATAYLYQRGINDVQLNDIRFHASVAHKDRNTGEVEFFPALLLLIRDAEGFPVNLQRIFLAKNGFGKAKFDDGSANKMMMQGLNTITGGAIRLSESFDGVLGIAEGFETSASVTKATGMAVWSVLSTSGMKGFVPPKNIHTLVIWADNDPFKPHPRDPKKGTYPGQDAAKALVERLKIERPDLKVEVCVPRNEGEDWNDVMNKNGFFPFSKYNKHVVNAA